MTDHSAAPVDRERHRVLAGRSRVRVLELLRAAPGPLSAVEIAARVDLHPNTVRLHLDQLVAVGLATREPQARDRPGRPRLVYAAGPSAVTEPSPIETVSGESRYHLLAEVLVDFLEQSASEPVAEATAAGRAWGHVLGRRTAGPAGVAQGSIGVASLLGEVGIAPRATVSGETLELRQCPFGQLPEDRSRVVCGIHLGLMQGLLTERGVPVLLSALEPFVRPGLCVAHVEAGGVSPDHAAGGAVNPAEEPKVPPVPTPPHAGSARRTAPADPW